MNKTSFLLRNKTSLLILITLIGLFLRVVYIQKSPPSLYGDELTIALDANSLLTTGHDQLGNFMPLTFPMGAGRPAGYVYFSIPFIAIFGPTALGVRGLSIISGVGLILLLYYIGKKLFSEDLGLLSAAIYAFSLWDISLSRGGFEAHLALFFAVAGFYLFIQAQERPKLYLPSAISFGLTLHTYPTYKFSLLLFLPLLFWFWGYQRILNSKKYFLTFLITLFILGSLALSQTFLGGSENRFFNINIFSQDKLRSSIEEKINLERNITQLPGSMAKYFHNRQIEYIKVFSEYYLQNFSMDFLFIHGDRNPRHNMATMGQFYFIEIVLIILGSVTAWYKQKRILIFLICWIILSPIPASIVDLPHALRSAFMLPPVVLLSAFGLKAILTTRNRLLIFMVVVAFAIQFIFFIQKLFFLAPAEYANFWSHSAKVTSEIAQQNKNKFKYVILLDEINDIEFAYPLFDKVSTEDVIYQNKNKSRLNNYQFKRFDNVYIGYIPHQDINKFVEDLDGSALFIGTPDTKNYLKDYEEITEIQALPILTVKRSYK